MRVNSRDLPGCGAGDVVVYLHALLEAGILTVLLFLAAWLVLLVIAATRSAMIFAFVGCQFAFIGAGLTILGYTGPGILAGIFPAFNSSSITPADVTAAHLVVLGGTAIAVIVSSFAPAGHPVFSSQNGHAFRERFLWAAVAFSVVVTAIYAAQFGPEALDFFSTERIGNMLELRDRATSNYLMVLAVYNLLPAIAVASFLYALQARSRAATILFLVAFCCASICLILTFQKRPLLIFLIIMGLAFAVRRGGFAAQSWKVMALGAPMVTLAAMISTYFLNGYRQYPFAVAVKVGSHVLMTRTLGRLAFPATMYVDYYPDHHPYYGLSNIGMLASLTGNPAYLDTFDVFSHYSNTVTRGSVAASVFIDAWGQAGFVGVVIYGVIVGLSLIAVTRLVSLTEKPSSRAFLITAGMLFVFYLSQASIFRSLMGYGGLWFFLTWLVLFRDAPGTLLRILSLKPPRAT
jgi:hypothetical protein